MIAGMINVWSCYQMYDEQKLTRIITKVILKAFNLSMKYKLKAFTIMLPTLIAIIHLITQPSLLHLLYALLPVLFLLYLPGIYNSRM